MCVVYTLQVYSGQAMHAWMGESGKTEGICMSRFAPYLKLSGRTSVPFLYEKRGDAANRFCTGETGTDLRALYSYVESSHTLQGSNENIKRGLSARKNKLGNAESWNSVRAWRQRWWQNAKVQEHDVTWIKRYHNNTKLLYEPTPT